MKLSLQIQLQNLHLSGWTDVFDVCTSTISLNAKIIWCQWKTKRAHYGDRAIQWGGGGYVAYNFVFLGSDTICRLLKIILSDEAPVALQLTVSISDLV
jgi:hypothetical protein